MAALLYLSLFAASSAGTLTDDLLDRRAGAALLGSIAHLAGFVAVLQWAMPEISYQTAALTVVCVIACMWDVWSSARAARSAWNRDDADAEVLGIALMLGARVPAYACPALLALKWIS